MYVSRESIDNAKKKSYLYKSPVTEEMRFKSVKLSTFLKFVKIYTRENIAVHNVPFYMLILSFILHKEKMCVNSIEKFQKWVKSETLYWGDCSST